MVIFSLTFISLHIDFFQLMVEKVVRKRLDSAATDIEFRKKFSGGNRDEIYVLGSVQRPQRVHRQKGIGKKTEFIVS